MTQNTSPCYLLVAKREAESDTKLLIFEAVEDAKAQAQYLFNVENYAEGEVRLIETVIHKVGATNDVPDEVLSGT